MTVPRYTEMYTRVHKVEMTPITPDRTSRHAMHMESEPDHGLRFRQKKRHPGSETHPHMGSGKTDRQSNTTVG